MSAPASPSRAESWLELPDGNLFWLQSRCAVGRQADNDLVLDLPWGADLKKCSGVCRPGRFV